MIRVPRTRVTPPPEWLERASQERDAAAEFFKAGYRGSPFPFRAALEAQPALMQLFEQKCAFCESPVGVVDVGDVCHFRPSARAIGLDGKVVTPAYWWLGSAWENLYLSCSFCNRNKGYRFPVAGRPARRPGEEAKEKPLLLDPCADDTERFFVFGEDGLVASRPLDASERSELGLSRLRYDRAEITIDVFGLNREGLVESRKGLAATLRSQFEHGLAVLRAGVDMSLALELLPPVLAATDDLNYAALRRQLSAEFERTLLTEFGDLLFADEVLGQIRDRLRVPTSRDVPAALEAKAVEEQLKLSAFDRLEKHRVRVKSSSIEDRDDKLVYHHTASVARVEIRNFRNIDHLEFEIPAGDFEQLGWKVLLGENGVGKSSVLQAVALTLMGSKRASTLKDVDKARLLRDGARPPRGYVRIYLSAESEPLELKVTRRGITHPAGSSNLRTFLLGFGATRWLPRRGALRPDNDRSIRVRNLFNPFMPLHDAPDWLQRLPERDFRRAEPAILRLLERPEGDRLRRLQGRVVIHPENEPLSRAISLEELSDGYQAMLAVAGEIAEITSDTWPNVAAAEGVVLLDEIGAHLHPRWKMRVVGTLRAAFPRMQFLASTHDPLCLRGLGASEILVLRRDDDGELVALDNLPGTDTMRIDQLLTSRLFGLGSTLDPDTEHAFTEYYSLLAKRQRDSKEESHLRQLRATVGSRGILGSTPRDQAIYQIIDEYLATHEASLNDQWASINDETKRRVTDLLKADSSA